MDSADTPAQRRRNHSSPKSPMASEAERPDRVDTPEPAPLTQRGDHSTAPVICVGCHRLVSDVGGHCSECCGDRWVKAYQIDIGGFVASGDAVSTDSDVKAVCPSNFDLDAIRNAHKEMLAVSMIASYPHA